MEQIASAKSSPKKQAADCIVLCEPMMTLWRKPLVAIYHSVSVHVTFKIDRASQKQGCKVLTPFRCAGLATFSFFVTWWPLFRPTAIAMVTALAALAQDVQPPKDKASPKTPWRLDLSAVTTSDSS